MKNEIKNWKCKFGLHSYEIICTQKVPNMFNAMSGSPIMRDVKKCIRCGNLSYFGYDALSNLHLNNTLNWEPKIKNKI